MLFNSLYFLFQYLPLVAFVFLALSRYRRQISILLRTLERNIGCACLALASLYFYAYWDVTYIFLLLGSIILNYKTGCWISMIRDSNKARAKTLLIRAVACNLLTLAYFKYFVFFTTSFNSLFGTSFPLFTIILPLGISFFTFTQIAFLVDVYQGKATEFNFIHYLLFVTYFPHLIAGPILHHAQMMPQFKRLEKFEINWDNLVIGISFFTIGLAKKVFIADTCAGFSTPIFDAAKAGKLIPFVDSWLGAYAYSLQLYFDFSGYCDMAIGISYIFNIRLPYNFNSPYKAVNIIDFWRRWHITLSVFLRDYLYIPLGGNRQGKWRRYANLFITMLLGGLWHGAGWTFILWGALHGLYLVINHGFHAFREKMGWKHGMWSLPGRMLGTGVTFVAVMIAWVLFRSENMLSVQTMLSCMTGGNGFSLTPVYIYHCPLLMHPLLIPGFILIWAMPNTQQLLGIHDTSDTETGTITGIPPWWMWVFIGTLLGAGIIQLLLAQMHGKTSEFLYYQF
ncbi:MAG: MBOAT family protein [Candidatus Methylacidiphilales bacterium]|nr:MBOAT family protein [Candidatus Methylacidiphilales bacterium]